MIMQAACCIVGGGPAGMMLGFLLARAGLRVVVLEKHADFLRDFRGDTIHPSTLELMAELGLLEDVLEILDFRAEQLMVNVSGTTLPGPTFAHLRTKCKFIGFVPQWDFLNLLSEKGKSYSGFELRMNAQATALMREQGKVTGVRCTTPDGEFVVKADLVVAADGRNSTIRDVANKAVTAMGVPIDALWLRTDFPATPNEDKHTLAWVNNGTMLITIPRRTHYQVAMVIRKGGFEEIRRAGLDSFRAAIGDACPVLRPVVGDLTDWEQVKLLRVQINHMEKWYENGLLFIGDAAHAMSPMGGVGINIAIQDAVAAANRLVEPLSNRSLTTEDLRAVQQRRMAPARRMQRLQARMHKTLFPESASPTRAIRIPWAFGMLAWIFAPLLRRLAGRYIGLGFLPEHIQTEEAIAATTRAD